MKLKLTLSLLCAAFAICSVRGFAAAGAVYTLTNASSGNAVLIFNRSDDGQISPAGMVSTGGLGTGAGLGSQGGLAIDANNSFLFAVNAGSDNISVFRIVANGLTLVGVTPSGGKHPISLTVNRRILYVLNNGAKVGASDTIAGFAVAANGHLTPIVTGLALSSSSVAPPQIGFNNDGTILVVTEKTTNNIDVFKVDDDGVAVGPMVIPSAGQTPFGFAFGKRNQLFVSDAFGGAVGAGAVTSYVLNANQKLQTVTKAAPDLQAAPCWVVLTNDSRYAYTTNTGSGTLSGYKVGFGGGLSLMNSDGITVSTGTGSGPVDEAISNDSRYLYALTPGTANIQAFFIALDGSLSPISQAVAIPSSASGLIAR